MGTSIRLRQYAVHYQDHPHAYGDKVVGHHTRYNEDGSSPRVWGQDPHSNTGSTLTRIIPTRMGTSGFVICIDLCNEDHPHAYGDKLCVRCGLQ